MNSALTETARLVQLVRKEQSAFAEFLLALADFDRRRLWAELGHSSLFYFLHRELRLSKGAAHYRKVAAELVQRFPEVIEPLRDGRLCITSVVALAKVMTPENRHEVLPRFFHCSKREAQAEAAAISPAEAAPRREVVTGLRAPTVVATLGQRELGEMTQSLVQPDEPREGARASGPADHFRPNASSSTKAMNPAPPTPSPALSASAPHDDSTPRWIPPQLTTGFASPNSPTDAQRPSPTAEVPVHPHPRAPTASAHPLTADLRRLHITVSRRFLEKLETARAALSHSHAGASAEEILEAGLDLLLERCAKRKGLVARPRKAKDPAAVAKLSQVLDATGAPGMIDASAQSPSRSSAYVPAHVKREVWLRDGGRCQWPLAAGGVCGSTLRLEIDHVVPRALGGPSTVGNLRLLCKTHNQLAARRVFGAEWMDRFTVARVAPSASSDEAAPG